MKGLILMDIYGMKPVFRKFFIFFIIWIINFMTHDNILLALITLTFIFGILSLQTIYNGEKSKWEGYSLTLPINRKDIVIGKYLFIYLTLLISSIVGIVLLTVFKSFIINGENIRIIFMVLVLNIVFFSIYIPTIFKYGMDKSTIIMFLSVSIIIMVILNLNRVLPVLRNKLFDFIEIISNMKLNLMISFSVSICVVMTIISILVSVWLIKQKEY